MEGVMMRGPERYAVAVRKPDGEIVVKSEPFLSITKKIKVLGWPFLRGGVVLIESLILGMRALTFSGDMAIEEEAEKKSRGFLPGVWMVLTMIFAFIMGLVLFFYAPLLLTELLGAKSGFVFNLVDGIIRLCIFVIYIYVISRWKEIRRVFEYHGAEHKSIFAYENRDELIPASAASYQTQHPRCGTSFLFIVILTSIVVFMFLGRPETIADRLIRFAFIPVIGGLSYELIKLSDRGYEKKFFRLFLLPGLWLQKITTQEPDESQLEVAMVALKSALGMDPHVGPSKIDILS